MCIIMILQAVSELYFLDEWNRVNSGVNDAYRAAYLRQFQSHGRNCGAVGTSTSQFEAATRIHTTCAIRCILTALSRIEIAFHYGHICTV